MGKGLVITILAGLVYCLYGCRRTDHSSDSPTCIKNMVLIEVAKDKWAAAEKKGDGAAADVAGVNSFLKDGKVPTCPNSGRYIYNSIGADPECSIHGSRTKAIMSFEK